MQVERKYFRRLLPFQIREMQMQIMKWCSKESQWTAEKEVLQSQLTAQEQHVCTDGLTIYFEAEE